MSFPDSILRYCELPTAICIGEMRASDPRNLQIGHIISATNFRHQRWLKRPRLMLPLWSISGVGYVRFVGYNQSFFPPRVLPPQGHNPEITCPQIPRGLLIAPDQNNSHRLPQLSATGSRVATCGATCPGVLPCPWHDQIAHQWGLAKQRGTCTGDYPEWPLYSRKRTVAGSQIRKLDVPYVLGTAVGAVIPLRAANDS
jgi:hypothetical protein